MSASQSSNDAEFIIDFFAWPLEIRYGIYDRLLVSMRRRQVSPHLIAGADQQIVFILEALKKYTTRKEGLGLPYPQYMQPAILRTSKQVYHEAIVALYGRNMFRCDAPLLVVEFTSSVGLENFAFVKSLQLAVPTPSEWEENKRPEILAQWVELFKMLAEKAKGLRFLEITWQDFGLSVPLVRALAKIQGLKRLVIEGLYGKNWPAFLREQMSGTEVHAKRGMLEHRNIKALLEEFEDFQDGTEDVFP
jgi:hypothetical protein